MRKPTSEAGETFARRAASGWRRLRARPELAVLRRLTRARGIGAWIVGGAPRDVLAGKKELDVDVAVMRDAEELARELSDRGFGTRVLLSETAPRVFRVAGRRIVDLSDVEGATVRDDLARRDFTANAIAIDLETGEWLDPFGGAEDVAAHRLRLVAEANLAADPLRAFRAARLFATHGLVPDRRTREACRRAGPLLATVAPERVASELTKLLSADRAAPAFRWAAEAGLLPYALGLELPAERFRAAASILARLERAARPLPAGRRIVLRLAGVAAGLRRDPAQTARWLSARRHGRSVSGGVARLLELSERAARAPSGTDAWAWIYDAGSLAADALALARARSPKSARPAARLAGLAGRARRGPRVTGEDVMTWSGLPPGPEVGARLREIRIEGLRGRIRTRSDARRLLRGGESTAFRRL